MRINARSVLLSGLAAGMAIIISALTMVPVVGNEMDRALADRGLPPLSRPAMAWFAAVSLAMGISLVWLYAVAKARLGAGMRTAAIVSLVVWFLAYFLANVSNVVYGFMPVRLTVIGTAWGLAEALLGGWIGFRLYREKRNE